MHRMWPLVSIRQMHRLWPLVSFLGSVVGFYFLLIWNPDVKFGAEDKQEWFVIVVWCGAHIIPFMLICKFLLGDQILGKCKDSWLPEAFMTYIFLAIPVVIEHLAQYPDFHIEVKDVKQHNSKKAGLLISACALSISSLGLSRTYGRNFESGFFSICLEHAMKFSMEIVNETGKHRNLYVLFGVYGFCLMVILWRKYLEKNPVSNTTSQRDDQSPDNTNTLYHDRNNRSDESPFAASDTFYSPSSDFGTMNSGLTLNQQNQPNEITARNLDRTPGDCRVQDENSQRDIRQESWDINEQNWESVPPMLYNDISSSNSGDNEDGVKEVLSETKFELKKGKDGVEEDEGTSNSDEYTGMIKESESQGIEHEEGNMRSSSSKDQNQESGSHGYEVDDNPLLHKNSLKVDDDDYDNDDFDHKSSDGEGSDGDDSNSGAGCKARVGRRRRNKRPMKEGQDIANLDGLRTAGCKVEVCQRGRNKCPAKEGRDITDSEQLKFLLIWMAQLWMLRELIPISECQAPRAKISELSNDDNNESSNDKERDEDGGVGSKDGVELSGDDNNESSNDKEMDEDGGAGSKNGVKLSGDDNNESYNDKHGDEDGGVGSKDGVELSGDDNNESSNTKESAEDGGLGSKDGLKLSSDDNNESSNDKVRDEDGGAGSTDGVELSDDDNNQFNKKPSKTLMLFEGCPRRLGCTRSSSKFRLGMDLFHNAKAVCLRSSHGKYLLADGNEESVIQGRNGSSKRARWVVEYVPGYDNIIRLKSFYGKYLTASNQPFLLGMTGRKVLQTIPRRLDSSVEWEPITDGAQVSLKTRYGNFLIANGGSPPWRNSVVHDIPYRTATQNWILWDVDVLEIHVRSPGQKPAAPPVPHLDSLDFQSDTPSAVSIEFANFSREESADSYVGSRPKIEGRTIYYHVAEDNGEVDDEDVQGYSLISKGNGVEELTRKFQEERGLENVILCTRSPSNGKLYPLPLHLPPNNDTMHDILVLPSSKVARDFEEQGLI